jgi:hypothetical protein
VTTQIKPETKPETKPAFHDPALAQLYDYWEGKRRDGKLPARADISPFEMRFIIGNICLVDVIAGAPPRFRMRLLGSNIVFALGAGDRTGKITDWTGGILDELPPTEFRAMIGRSFEAVARTREPLVACRDVIMDNRAYRYEATVLPLATDGETVDMLLVGLIYGRPQGVAR